MQIKLNIFPDRNEIDNDAIRVIDVITETNSNTLRRLNFNH